MLKITKNQGSIQVTADQSGFYPFDGTLTFPTNSLFTCAQNNTDMITFKSTSNGDVQFVGNYKDITISGRSYDTKQKFLTAFSNLANQGSVDAYTKAETDAKIDAKQGKLKAGNGITLTEDATDGTTVVKTAVSLTDNGNGAYEVGDSIEIGSDTVVIGKSAISRSKSSIAIGKGATSGSGTSNVAIGLLANSSGGSSIAIGNKTETSNMQAIAIGTLAGAYIPKSIAIGYNANAVTDKPIVINAGGKTMIQSDSNGKISIIKGDGSDERMVIQDEIEALKNAGGGGSVDAYTKAETDTKLDAKQDKLTAGSGITITKDETAGTNTIATAVSLTDNGNGAYTVGDSIKMGSGIAIGKNASGHNDSITVGYGARATKSYCTVIGNGARATNYNCTVIGEDASALNDYCTVIGTDACSYSHNSIAVGYHASIDSNSHNSITVGYGAQAHSENSVAIGKISNATKDTPLVINAGYKTVDNVKKPLTVLQSDSTGKLSILKGDGTDERIVIQDALSAGGSGGSVDAYTKAETDNLLNAKQNTLTAGTGITIDENNVISSTGGGGGANPLVNVKGTDSATITDTVTDAVAIGSGAKVTEELSVAIGAANALSGHCVAIGGGANATKMSSVAIGDGACATAHMFDVAIGFHAATTDTKPLEINAGYKTVGGATTPLTVLQSDANGKLSILKGDDSDERMVISDEITARKAEITTLKAEIAALKGGASTGA